MISILYLPWMNTFKDGCYTSKIDWVDSKVKISSSMSFHNVYDSIKIKFPGSMSYTV